MTIEDNIFKRAVADFAKLKEYGFVKSGELMVYEELFMNGDFKAVLTVNIVGKISGKVYDVASDDEYLPLRVEDMATGYVGQVRTAYETVLQKIKLKCYHENYFTGTQANRIAAAIKQEYGDEPDFPWGKDDDGGVFRNQDNAKWYALIMTINRSKIEPAKNGKIEVMNIKLSEEKIPLLIQQDGFYPAYHMNKKYWITMVLDDTLDDATLMKYIDESHEFTMRKKQNRKIKKRVANRV